MGLVSQLSKWPLKFKIISLIATLPGSQIWSCLFFVTMIMLGMDSAVSIFVLDCAMTGDCHGAVYKQKHDPYWNLKRL